MIFVQNIAQRMFWQQKCAQKLTVNVHNIVHNIHNISHNIHNIIHNIATFFATSQHQNNVVKNVAKKIIFTLVSLDFVDLMAQVHLCERSLRRVSGRLLRRFHSVRTMERHRFRLGSYLLPSDINQTPTISHYDMEPILFAGSPFIILSLRSRTTTTTEFPFCRHYNRYQASMKRNLEAPTSRTSVFTCPAVQFSEMIVQSTTQDAPTTSDF